MARNITDAQRPLTVPFPVKRVNWKQLMVWLIVTCVVAGLSIGGYYLYDQVTSTAVQPPPVVQPPVVVPATPTVPATSTNVSPEVELVFFGDLGLIIFFRGEEHFAYILGRMAPLGPDVPQEYGFPLYIERDAGKGREINVKIITSIPDPNINEIGAEWNSGLIKDPDYDNFVLRVRLIRATETVAGIYKYKMKFYFSPDGGQTWLGPAEQPTG